MSCGDIFSAAKRIKEEAKRTVRHYGLDPDSEEFAEMVALLELTDELQPTTITASPEVVRAITE